MLICLVLETVWKEVIPQYSFVVVEFETGDFVNIFTNCCIHLVGLQILLIFIRRNLKVKIWSIIIKCVKKFAVRFVPKQKKKLSKVSRIENPWGFSVLASLRLGHFKPLNPILYVCFSHTVSLTKTIINFITGKLRQSWWPSGCLTAMREVSCQSWSNLPSYLYWNMHVRKWLAAMLAVKRWTGVTPEMNLSNIYHMPLPSAIKAAHSGFEAQRRHHQQSKTGVSMAPQKGLM